jgi:hypothetical protein
LQKQEFALLRMPSRASAAFILLTIRALRERHGGTTWPPIVRRSFRLEAPALVIKR